jgi:secondary thiamine-phosphate synthase enzyme
MRQESPIMTADRPAPPSEAAWQVTHEIVGIKTRRRLQFVDITDRLVQLVRRNGLLTGVLSVQTRHTTTGLVINEHEPLLLRDLTATLERFAPREVDYEHDNLAQRSVPPLEPRNGHAHCKALGLRASESIHVVDGDLWLGRWQRVFLVELDGGRERELSVMLLGTARAPQAGNGGPRAGRGIRRFAVHAGKREG